MKRILFVSTFVLGACAAQKPSEVASNDPPHSAPRTGTAEQTEAREDLPQKEAPKSLPASCASNEGGVCTPDSDFAGRMCNANFPDAALALFAKDSPFTRLYLRGDVDGWNADGGLSARQRLVFDEEVLALKRRAAQKTGIVINGGGAGYLVMRWDGTCYTLEDGEITMRKPPAPKSSTIRWKYLSDRTKDVLLGNQRILAAYQKLGRECKGATTGDVPKSCELADVELSRAIAQEIRSGLAVPTPERLP